MTILVNVEDEVELKLRMRTTADAPAFRHRTHRLGIVYCIFIFTYLPNKGSSPRELDANSCWYDSILTCSEHASLNSI